jgi:hypothetical protein
LLKRKFVVDDLTFELFPQIGHVAPPKANSRKAVNRDTWAGTVVRPAKEHRGI